MQWETGFKNTFPDAEWVKNPTNQADCYLFMWCDEVAVNFINNSLKHAPYIVYVRRYEMFNKWIKELDWSKVDEVIMVNDFLADRFYEITGRKAHVIYNAVDINKWKYKERKHGNQIAWVGFINQKKNLPLALQIMAGLPKNYELHIAGGIQDMQTLLYLEHIVKELQIQVTLNGQIPHEFMDEWLEDKNYILSTAISEGCPNNVIEAMAKGIKPIIHNWPGAEEQFSVFNTIDEACNMISLGSEYNSTLYKSITIEKSGCLLFLIPKFLINHRRLEIQRLFFLYLGTFILVNIFLINFSVSIT